MRYLFKNILALLILIGLGVFSYLYIFNIGAPCSEPLTYSIGTIDQRFNISQSDVLAATKKAVAFWNNAAGKTLFSYDPASSFTVSLSYDSRQQISEQIDATQQQIDGLVQNQNNIEKVYQDLKAEYDKQRTNYEAASASYKEAYNSYQAEVSSWNERGGAPKNVYNQLQETRNKLQDQYQALENQRQTLNDLANKLNKIVAENNSLASNINNRVAVYNDTFSHEQFEQGQYFGDTITIYEFKNQNDLVYVLAHEFGHALGLDHVQDPDAVMYYSSAPIPADQKIQLTKADIDEMKQVCGLAPYSPKPWYERVSLKPSFISFVKQYL